MVYSTQAIFWRQGVGFRYEVTGGKLYHAVALPQISDLYIVTEYIYRSFRDALKV